jgi:hypothetical protein
MHPAMKPYDPRKPLISLHVPKCAGQSFRRILKRWFGERLLFHYVQEYHIPPPRHPLQEGICIHGHFNAAKGFGVNAYYPEADQLITVLRDPLEMHLSNYFYWKTKARERQLGSGLISPGGEHDYRDINDFFRKRPRSTMLNFLPGDMTPETYRTIFAERFVWIGVVEDIEHGVIRLARALGVKPAAVPRVNASARSETLAPELREAFIRDNSFAFELYRYVAENCGHL